MKSNLKSEHDAYVYLENFITANIKNLIDIKILNNSNTCSFTIDQTSLSNISKGIIFPTSLFRGFIAPQVKNGKIFDSSSKNPTNPYASSFFQKLIDESLLSAVTKGNNNQFVTFIVPIDSLNKFTGNYGSVQTCYFEISFSR
jgi:hypothetical protein